MRSRSLRRWSIVWPRARTRSASGASIADWPCARWRGGREISAAMLSEIEVGKKEGSIRTLAALARALGVDTDDLIPWLKD